MATITQANNPALHARLVRNLASETVGWERPAHVMNGGTQYTVHELADGSFEFTEANSEVMHDSTSNFPGR
jgi:hypothetical protein